MWRLTGISVDGTMMMPIVTVEAESEEEAKEKAKDIIDGDFIIEVIDEESEVDK